MGDGNATAARHQHRGMGTGSKPAQEPCYCMRWSNLESLVCFGMQRLCGFAPQQRGPHSGSFSSSLKSWFAWAAAQARAQARLNSKSSYTTSVAGRRGVYMVANGSNVLVEARQMLVVGSQNPAQKQQVLARSSSTCPPCMWPHLSCRRAGAVDSDPSDARLHST